jgi:hypothetical protein
MHLLITGSRGIKQQPVWDCLDGFYAKYPITELTHGGARGVDIASACWANHSPVRQRVMLRVNHRPANWDYYGKRAGLIRNEEMLATCPALDCAYLAIWDGMSTGTAHMVGLMRAAVRMAYPKQCFNNEPLVWHDWGDFKLAFHVPQHIYTEVA